MDRFDAASNPISHSSFDSYGEPFFRVDLVSFLLCVPWVSANFESRGGL
jgi:hypothetical protein